MPTLDRIERSIFDLEGFHVAFRRKSPTTGLLRDARGDMKRLPPYDYDYKFQGNRKVSEWLAIRIEPRYGEYGLLPIVLYEDGSSAPGHTLIRNVRQSYPTRRR